MLLLLLLVGLLTMFGIPYPLEDSTASAIGTNCWVALSTLQSTLLFLLNRVRDDEIDGAGFLGYFFLLELRSLGVLGLQHTGGGAKASPARG